MKFWFDNLPKQVTQTKKSSASHIKIDYQYYFCNQYNLKGDTSANQMLSNESVQT